METKNKICTTINQSKKLLELGIDIYTADMFWRNGVSEEYIQCFTPFVSTGTNVDFDYDVPAWSLSALLGLIKSEIYSKNIYGDTVTYKVDFRKYKFTDDAELYQIAYGSVNFDEDGHDTFKTMIDTGQKEDPLDTAFQMVCWLLESNKKELNAK
jgi:hypothetical protein